VFEFGSRRSLCHPEPGGSQGRAALALSRPNAVRPHASHNFLIAQFTFQWRSAYQLTRMQAAPLGASQVSLRAVDVNIPR
jgi:hypothetical protein